MGSNMPVYQGAAFRRASRVVLVVLLAMFVAPSVAGGTGTASGFPVLAIFLVCFAAAWEARLRRMGIRIEADRIVAIYAIGQRCFAIDTVAGFSLRRHGSSGGTRCVFIDLVNGKRRVVPSVSTADWGPFKSNAIRWAGGETTDVVTYLNEQLNMARGRQAHHPPSPGDA